MNTTELILQGGDFTPPKLVAWLNENFTKPSKAAFTLQDVQGYVSRGVLPPRYGDLKIEVIEDKTIGVKVLRLSPK